MENWLEKQRAYQESTYGLDYQKMWQDGTIVNYVSTMLTAAQIEIAEAFQEVPWKPWAQLTPEQRTNRLDENAMKVAGELVDVLFFVSNALVGLLVVDEELDELYAAKMGVNRKRQVDGYDGISTKCGSCGRALDEPGAAKPVEGHSGRLYCGYICGATEDDVTIQKTDSRDVTLACGHVVGPLDLVSTGLDGQVYCGTRCATQHSGGQKDLEDVTE